jgi:hypothetical protein
LSLLFIQAKKLCEAIVRPGLLIAQFFLRRRRHLFDPTHYFVVTEIRSESYTQTPFFDHFRGMTSSSQHCGKPPDRDMPMTLRDAAVPDFLDDLQQSIGETLITRAAADLPLTILLTNGSPGLLDNVHMQQRADVIELIIGSISNFALSYDARLRISAAREPEKLMRLSADRVGAELLDQDRLRRLPLALRIRKRSGRLDAPNCLQTAWCSYNHAWGWHPGCVALVLENPALLCPGRYCAVVPVHVYKKTH